jgi:hypothetical protein
MKLITDNTRSGNHWLIKFYNELHNCDLPFLIKDERRKAFLDLWRAAFLNLYPYYKKDKNKLYIINMLFTNGIMKTSDFWFVEHENTFMIGFLGTEHFLIQCKKHLEDGKFFEFK